MKYVPLIFKNLTRNYRRSILTLLSIATSFFVFTALTSLLMTMTGNPDEEISGDGITVGAKGGGTLPNAYIKEIVTRFGPSNPEEGYDAVTLDRIAKEGFLADKSRRVRVDAIMGFIWGAGGTMGSEKLRLSVIDPISLRQVWTDMKLVNEEYYNNFLKDNRTILLGEKTMEQFGFKIGDAIEIPLSLRGKELKVSFKIAGPSQKKGMWANTSYVHRSYIQELMQASDVNMIFLTVRNKKDMVDALQELETLFSNRSPPVEVGVSGAFIMDLRDTMKGLTHLLMIATIFIVGIVLLMAGNSMILSIRARVSDVAVLKTVGFSRLRIVLLLLSESAALGLVGGLIGCGAAWLTLGRIPFKIGAASYFTVEETMVYAGVVLATFIGIMSGLIPSVQISRLRITDGMRRVE